MIDSQSLLEIAWKYPIKEHESSEYSKILLSLLEHGIRPQELFENGHLFSLQDIECIIVKTIDEKTREDLLNAIIDGINQINDDNDDEKIYFDRFLDLLLRHSERISIHQLLKSFSTLRNDHLAKGLPKILDKDASTEVCGQILNIITHNVPDFIIQDDVDDFNRLALVTISKMPQESKDSLDAEDFIISIDQFFRKCMINLYTGTNGYYFNDDEMTSSLLAIEQIFSQLPCVNGYAMAIVGFVEGEKNVLKKSKRRTKMLKQYLMILMRHVSDLQAFNDFGGNINHLIKVIVSLNPSSLDIEYFSNYLPHYSVMVKIIKKTNVKTLNKYFPDELTHIIYEYKKIA